MNINNNSHNNRKEVQAAVAGRPAGSARACTTAELFGTERQVRILHNGEEYRLSLTKAGKLILTK